MEQTININGVEIRIEVTPSAAPNISESDLDWSHTLIEGEAVTLEDAEQAVTELGEGWRLPTRAELESLLDLSRHDPAIDTEKYPDTQSRYYWTCTPCAWNSAARWVVNFSNGLVHGRRHYNACVRAVRSTETPAEVPSDE